MEGIEAKPQVPADLTPPDAVFIRGLTTSAPVGLDAWQRPHRAQPVVIDVRIPADLEASGASDSIDRGNLDYGRIAKAILQAVRPDVNFNNVDDVYEVVSDAMKPPGADRKSWAKPEVTVTLPEGALLADGVGIRVLRRDGRDNYFFVRKMRVACIIGLNLHERDVKQDVVIDLKLNPICGYWLDGYHAMIREVVKHVSGSSYKTLEALAESISELIGERATELGKEDMCRWITVAIEKPRAVAFVQGPGVEITRWFQEE